MLQNEVLLIIGQNRQEKIFVFGGVYITFFFSFFSFTHNWLVSRCWKILRKMCLPKCVIIFKNLNKRLLPPQGCSSGFVHWWHMNSISVKRRHIFSFDGFYPKWDSRVFQCRQFYWATSQCPLVYWTWVQESYRRNRLANKSTFGQCVKSEEWQNGHEAAIHLLLVKNKWIPAFLFN